MKKVGSRSRSRKDEWGKVAVGSRCVSLFALAANGWQLEVQCSEFRLEESWQSQFAEESIECRIGESFKWDKWF